MKFACTLCVLLWALVSGLIYRHALAERQEHLAENRQVLATTYQASITTFRLATEILFEDVIQRPEVIATFAEGVLGNEATASLARGKLYRLLSPAYAHLKARGIEQLQFHTADGRSFLRFHAPDRFGDPLFDLQPGVRIANTEQRAIFGFEVGRMSASFRYVFPLRREHQHLGSVEASVAFRSISEAMSAIEPGREYLLVSRKEIVNRALFEDQRALYAASPIHSGFLVEDPQLRLPGTPPPLSAAVQRLNAQLHDDPRVQHGLPAGQPFSLALSSAGKDWVVAFEPIANLLGQNVAYVISYTPAPFLASLRSELLGSLVLTTLAFAGLLWLTVRLLHSHTNLRKQKQHLQIITDTISDGLCVMDAQGRIVSINPAFTEILGYRQDDVVGKIGHHIFHLHGEGGSLPIEQCPIVAATGSGREYCGEETFLHQDGRRLAVEVACKPFSKDNYMQGSVTAFRDITERKLAQDRLAEAHRLMAEAVEQAKFEREKTLSILETMADGISIQDPELRVIYQNAAHRARMGDHLGEFCYQAYQGQPDVCPGCHLAQSFADGQVHIRETTASPAGELRHFQIVSTPLFDSSGTLIAGIEAVRDITTRIRAEETLRRKTLELEEANRELEAFSYTLSHDLRSHLARINLAGESLRELESAHHGADGAYFLQTILNTCQSMDDLISTMLTLAHISRQELQLQDIDLSTLAGHICRDLANAEPERSLRFSIAPGIHVTADAHLLQVVLENLLGNACKYTRETAEALVTVSARRQDDRLVIAIADNGTGFDMAEAQKLFRPFQRLSTAQAFPGFGIGLTTVERIIKRHGGEVWAEAVPGQGATFSFSLPA